MIHKWTFQGIDTEHIKTKRDNGYVWALVRGKQVRMTRLEAMRKGYKIIQKRANRDAEVKDGVYS